MEFAPDWVLEIGQFEKPSFQIAGPHTSVPALFLIPIDSICGVVTRERSIGLPRMIVDGPQRPHAAIRDVGTVLLSKLIMLFGDASGIIREIQQRGLQPFRKEAFNVIAIPADRFLATAFSDQVGFQVALPSLLQGGGPYSTIPIGPGLFGVSVLPRFRVLSLADLSKTTALR
jgi:hypothetical protein